MLFHAEQPVNPTAITERVGIDRETFYGRRDALQDMGMAITVENAGNIPCSSSPTPTPISGASNSRRSATGLLATASMRASPS